jgi:hypothetical protein
VFYRLVIAYTRFSHNSIKNLDKFVLLEITVALVSSIFKNVIFKKRRRLLNPKLNKV